MPPLPGQVVVLTGASSGIGEAGAVALGRGGATLRLVARRAEELERVRDRVVEAGGAATVHPADLSDLDAVDALAEELVAAGPVDVLVNNAARSIRRPVLEQAERPHDLERLADLNYLAPARLALRLLPTMVAHGGGHLVSVSSQSTLVPVPRYAAYVGAKSALEGFTRSVATELRGHGVTATIVNYPLVRTPMVEPTAIYRNLKMMDVDEAADWLVRAVRDRPARIADARGRAFAVATAMAPGPTTKAAGWFFDRMAKRLARRASGG